MDKRRKILIIIGVVVLSAAVIYRFFPAVKGLEPSPDALFMKEREIAKFTKVIQEKPDLEKKLKSLGVELERMERGLLSGHTSALAASEIQSILSKIAEQIGVEFQTMRIVQAKKEKESSYLGIPVQFRINCSIRQLKDLLYQIESSQKYLKIDSMRIEVRGKGDSATLLSDLTVMGFMKNREN